MTGPEHWRKAEFLLETTGEDDHYRAYRLRAAQIHATLALAAATMARNMALTPADRHEWQKAIDPEYAAEQAAEATR